MSTTTLQPSLSDCTSQTQPQAIQTPSGKLASGAIHSPHSARPGGQTPALSAKSSSAASPGLLTSTHRRLAPAQAGILSKMTTQGLALTGLGIVAASVWLSYQMGEIDRVRNFIADWPNFITFSAIDEAYYPSVSGYLGLVFAGPLGAILTAALAICMGMGLWALRSGRRSQPRLFPKALPLTAAYLLPFLVLGFAIFSAFEFAGAYAMPATLRAQPALIDIWVITALSCAALLTLSSTALLLIWAWRRENRLTKCA